MTLNSSLLRARSGSAIASFSSLAFLAASSSSRFFAFTNRDTIQ